MTEEVGGASPRHSRGEPGAQPLTLITLAGDELPIEVDPVGHASLRSFENAVLARLPLLGNASTLGCELQFVQTNTLQVLADPVLVENGVKIVGEAAWRCCRQLQIVHLPDTVVSLLHGAFSRCQVLRVVVAPGCKYFGTKVFEECCSLTQVGAAHCPSNKLAPQAQLRPRAFQACTALRSINLGMSESATTYPNRCLPDCCFQESGIVELALPTSFNRIGSAVC